MPRPTPLILVSHGSTMMLGEQSLVTRDWEEMGRQAEKRGIKGVVIMGAHWEKSGENLVHVSTKPNPGYGPIAWVHPNKFKDYHINGSPELGHRVTEMLVAGGIKAIEDPKSDWIHDSLIPLKWMFPKKCPPATLISLNSKYDPSFHSRIGRLVNPLRDDNILIIGSGGTVHNLYRNNWPQIILHRNNFAQETPPERWALQFRQVIFDILTKRNQEAADTDGRDLRESAVRLMHHPLFREAHGTDDHYMATCFVLGAVREDEYAKKTSEVWELQNMCNTQYVIGEW